jgi:hypothetical protein
MDDRTVGAFRKMLQCIVAGRDGGEPEDEFFTRMMRQTGAATPDFVSACHFAITSTYEGHPLGVPAADEGFHDADTTERSVRQIAY